MQKTFVDYFVLFLLFGLIALGFVYIVIIWFLGFKCPKCKKRGVKKISEVYMGVNNDTLSSSQYFVTYKCKNCGHSYNDYESKGDLVNA